MLPIYNAASSNNITKIHNILMKAARTAIGNYCFKKSITYILKQCKWISARSMIQYSSLVFIYNIINNKKPKSILNIYKTQRFLRHKADISLNDLPKNKKYSKFFMQEHTNTYNKIPIEIRQKSKAVFKKELKLWISAQPKDTMD